MSVFVLVLITLISCDFRKSVNIDVLTGLNTLGDGLSCDDVYISDGENKLSRNTFTYGEKFYLNFDNIEGFNRIANSAFPGMQLYVTDQEGDTVLKNSDLYAEYTDGIDIDPLLLQTNLTVADPIHSINEYTLQINIWDKKGKGTFTAILDFDVIPNDQIIIESKNVSYGEIYLFSGESNSTITSNNANFNETIYLLFEGLDGFKHEGGMVHFGLSIIVSDAEGEMILNEEDLIGDTRMELSEFTSQIAPNFSINDPNTKNPVSSEIIIWDKNSECRISASTKLNLK